ncbi:MAG: 1-acyl-sn-glycerol-3-phosphate acyltransferase [Acholeplasmatales bacterium]|jgi:1-acyl-sn-glycerol-3-phosphate acyltransferase|nr:1-acyl-sn-glycerol-3-phosphate acyltransferase [Acholeplasmatales bacterium]
MNNFVLLFFKITAYFPAKLYFRAHSKYLSLSTIPLIKHFKRAIIISNHTSVYDFGLYIFLFFWHKLYVIAGENLYEKKSLARFITQIGAIKTNRTGYDFSYFSEALNILFADNFLLYFPEAKLNAQGADLEFKDSYLRLALQSDSVIIPIYTDGQYHKKGGSHQLIGKPHHLEDLWDSQLSEEDNIKAMNNYFKNYLTTLKEQLYAKKA